MRFAVRSIAAGAFSLSAALLVSDAAQAQLDGLVGDLVRDELEDVIRDEAVEYLQEEVLGQEQEETTNQTVVVVTQPAAEAPREVTTGGPGVAPARLRDAIELVGSADLSIDRNGAPQIAGRIEDVIYRVTFHSCDSDENCAHAVFSAGFADAEADLDALNAWNAERIFGTALIDDAGVVRLKMSMNFVGAGSDAHLDSSVERWRFAIVEFRGFLSR